MERWYNSFIARMTPNRRGHMASYIERRKFLATLLGGAAAAWPLAARAQQAGKPVIGFVNAGSAKGGYARPVSAFRQGLSETGYVERRNVAIEWRWAEGQYDRLPALIADLVHSNVTGSTQLNVEVAPKRLELLHEVIPTATAVAVLLNPSNPNGELTWRRLQPAAGVLGIKLHRLHVSSDFAAVFATLLQMRADALVISPDSLFTSRAEELAALALRHRVPAIYQYPEFTAAGGLMSYGGSIWDSYHRAGVYVGRILKGEKPADLPVQQSTKVELIINLKTARALGLTVPPTLLARADEVIE